MRIGLIDVDGHNFPDIIHLGDAFQVRDDGWILPGQIAEQPEKVVAV